MIRTVWSLSIITFATLVFGPLAILGGVFGVRSLDYYDWCGRTWSRWILWGAGAAVRVEGLEHLDQDTPQVLVANHQSWFDVPAIAAFLPKNFHFVAKKELERVFIFGRAWKAAGHISIDRTDRQSAVQSLDQAGAQLRDEGSAVIIFAEGTRADSDELQPFKKGAFMLALHTGVPILPVAVAGTRRIMPKGRWRVRKGPIIVRFGPPIATDDVGPDDRAALIEEVRRQVRTLRDEGRRELGPGRLETVPAETAPESTN